MANKKRLNIGYYRIQCKHCLNSVTLTNDEVKSGWRCPFCFNVNSGRK